MWKHILANIAGPQAEQLVGRRWQSICWRKLLFEALIVLAVLLSSSLLAQR
ncbi:MAG TPA: hypothetical protein VG675_07985 [Bryobacteraceae bacterium]|nr:hypothetical protein [Bryobacteraceae bacterium]